MTDREWRRRLAEGAVIVASILLAFAIDAAWDARTERLRRDALLAALEREMAIASDERDRVARYHAAGQEAAGALLMFDVESPLDRLAAPAVDSLLQLAYNNTATFDAPSGALEGLLLSNNLDLIDDEALLIELSAYPGLASNLSREQGYLVEVAFRLVDYLGAEGVDLSLLNDSTTDPGVPSVPWRLGRTDAYSVVGEAQFRSLLNELWWRYGNSLVSLSEMRQTIDRIRLLSGPGSVR
jgi:hypothetical protein